MNELPSHPQAHVLSMEKSRVIPLLGAVANLLGRTKNFKLHLNSG